MNVTEIRVKVLRDGQLKIETDKVQPAAHDSADNLIKHIVKDAGGVHTVERKAHGDRIHLHEEVHEHEHEHEHEHHSP